MDEKLTYDLVVIIYSFLRDKCDCCSVYDQTECAICDSSFFRCLKYPTWFCSKSCQSQAFLLL